ncbi:hypothetical protein [Cellulomonas cellasea]|uniref:hypothetical protein n=1 Tax=Cellulomonas cellasea TaxID=43670 RepID=UPI0016210E54|nr:hypothetical protein [Cellulomonas cellasea]
MTSSLDLGSPAAAGSTSLDLGSPAVASSSLDLGSPAAGSSSLDLGSPAAGSSSLDLGSPAAGSTSLDLTSAPAPPAPTAPPAPVRSAAPAPARTSLRPPPAPSGPPAPPPTRGPSTTTTSLDLAASPAPPAPVRRARPAPPSAAAGDLVLAFTPPRVHAGSPVVLGPAEPVVALTALQSGVGGLTVEAACSDAVGDLRLACAYRLAGARPSLVAHSREIPVAGLHARRPVIVSSRERFEQLVVDLRQVRSLERLVVLAYSESGAALDWGGTLVVHGFGGLRVEAPLRHGRSAGVLVALSVLRVGGELVLRAEDELVEGTLRDACTAHGFDEITWVDTRTPLV